MHALIGLGAHWAHRKPLSGENERRLVDDGFYWQVVRRVLEGTTCKALCTTGNAGWPWEQFLGSLIGVLADCGTTSALAGWVRCSNNSANHYYHYLCVHLVRRQITAGLTLGEAVDAPIWCATPPHWQLPGGKGRSTYSAPTSCRIYVMDNTSGLYTILHSQGTHAEALLPVGLSSAGPALGLCFDEPSSSQLLSSLEQVRQ